MIWRNFLAVLLVAGLAVPVLAGDGDSGAPDGASVDQPVNTGDCSCTARHETLTRQAIERYYAGAQEQSTEDREEALRLARLVLELDPDHEGARTLLAELEDR